MLTAAVQAVIAVVALGVVVLLLRDAARRRRTLASLGTAVLVAVNAASILVTLVPAHADLIQSFLNVPFHIVLLLLFATYPNGRFVPRWTATVVAVGTAAQLAEVASGFTWSSRQPWWAVHLLALWVVLLVGGQLTRFRRRLSVEERRRTSWPVLGALTTMVGFTTFSTIQIGATGTLEGDPGSALAAALMSLIPFGFAIGLLAPGIFRVDRALRAVIAVSVVALVAAGVFTAAMALPRLGWSPAVAAWLGAVVVAIAVWPLGVLGGRLADRVVFGARVDPLTALTRFGAQLERTTGPDEVPREIAETIAHALALSAVSVERPGRPVVAVGEHGPDAERFPVGYQGKPLAEIVASPRPGEDDLSPRDRETIGHLARQAGPALHDASLVDDLIAARSRVILAREEERRRLRRDLHDDLSPTLAGLSLRAEAVRAFAAGGDPRAVPLAEQLGTDLSLAAKQVRDIAYDLRPPVLDDLGLVAAIRDRVEATGAVPEILIDAPAERLDLPAAVELTALRLVQEAVVNVRRHAAAAHCRIELVRIGQSLVVSVTDDGIGISPDRRDGIGLRSMRERVDALGGRLEVTRLTPGTRIRAELPLSANGPEPSITAPGDPTQPVIPGYDPGSHLGEIAARWPGRSGA